MHEKMPGFRAAVAVALYAALMGASARAQDKPAEPQAEPEPKTAPVRKDRVYLKDLEGTWISRDYVERLRASRAPHATARQATGVAIKIQREGNGYPILITNFRRVVLQAVIDVQPDGKPGSYRLVVAKEDRPGINSSEVSYIYFRGERNPEGVFRALSIAEPTFAKRRFLTYLRLTEPLETFVNRVVVAGEYADAEGRPYEFTESGEAILPESSFAYEISLDPSSADCELIQGREGDAEARQRIGFGWKGPDLRLYKVTGEKPPYQCAAKPFAVLQRQ